MQLLSVGTILFLIIAGSQILRLQHGARPYAVLLLNFLFISSFLHNFNNLITCLLFMVACYPLIFTKNKSPNIKMIRIILIITIWAIIKANDAYSFTLNDIKTSLDCLGLSYILFRTISLAVNQEAEKCSFTDYANYCLFFLTFISGPITQQKTYDNSFLKIEPTTEMFEATVRKGLRKIAIGYFLVVAVSTSLELIFDMASNRFHDHEYMHRSEWFAVSAISYLFYLYANFAGYMYIVIGIGILVGVRVEENFNYPLMADNFLDFWNRWHITLSNWFRAYVFNPAMKTMLDVFGDKGNLIILSAAAYVCTFLLMGAWHGFNMNCLIYGMLVGTGVAVNKVWQMFIIKAIGKTEYANACKNSDIYKLFCNGLTLAYFSQALTFLWMNYDDLSTPNFWMSYTHALVYGTVFFSALRFLSDCLVAGWRHTNFNSVDLPPLKIIRLSESAFSISIIVVISAANIHKPLPFIYQGF